MELDWDLFERLEAMVPEVSERWKTYCHLPSPIDQLCAAPDRSVIILSPPGAGLSTALALMPQYELLSFAYSPYQWPGAPGAFTQATTHFEQWMGHIAQQITTRLNERPALIGQLTPNNLELLLWLTQRYRGERARDTLLQRLSAHTSPSIHTSLTAAIQRPDFQQLYGNTGSERAALIDECVEIARILGWKGIYAAIDVSWADWVYRSVESRKQLNAGIRELLSTLSPLQVPGFGYKMGLPTTLDLTESEIRSLIRGRAVVTRWIWNPAHVRDLVRRYVSVVGAGALPADYALSDSDWDILSGDMLAIWGALGPAAATALARQLLEHAKLDDESRLITIRRKLYAERALLWLDPSHDLRTVWRGAVPVVFEETPFRFVERLWRDRGNPVSNMVLMPMAGHSQHNLDKNINRIRGKLEPFYGENREYVYIQRSPSQGARLTCYVKAEHVAHESDYTASE